MRWKYGIAVIVFAAAASGGRSVSAADAWHVPEAAVRYAVTIAESPVIATPDLAGTALGSGIVDSLSWRPVPDVFLADLPAKQSTLVFDPTMKWLVPGFDGRTKGQKQPPNAEGTWEIRPEYRWFVASEPKCQVFIDGKPVVSEPASGPRWELTQQRFRIPETAKELRFVPGGVHRQVGFVTRFPSVAEARLCLQGLSATDLTPAVIADDATAEGKRVGAVAVPAADADPWTVLFDASGGAERYWVYAVPKREASPGPEWKPGAGVFLAARSLERFDERVGSVEGFREAWKRSKPLGYARVDGLLLNWLPFTAEGEVLRRAVTPPSPAWMLVRWNASLNLPGAATYRLALEAKAGATLLIDGKPALTVDAEADKPEAFVDLELQAGRHELEMQQWCRDGKITMSASLGFPGEQNFFVIGTVRDWRGSGFDFAETVARTKVAGFEPRPKQPGERSPPAVSIDWTADSPAHWYWSAYAAAPAEDLVGLHFRGALHPPQDGATFRFAFDDGDTAEGRDVFHVFASPGIRTVTCTALGSDGRTIAEATAKVRVEANLWTLPIHNPAHWYQVVRNRSFSSAAPQFRRQVPLFPKMPIADVLNIHAWASQTKDADLQEAAGRAVASRLDEARRLLDPDGKIFHANLLAVDRGRQPEAARDLLAEVAGESAIGSPRRLRATLALADVLATRLGRPAEALAILDALAGTPPPVDWHAGWESALDSLVFEDHEVTPVKELLAAKRAEPLGWQPFDTIWRAGHIWLFECVGGFQDPPRAELAIDGSAGTGSEIDIDVAGLERLRMKGSSSAAIDVRNPRFELPDGEKRFADIELSFWPGNRPARNFAGPSGFSALDFDLMASIPDGARRFKATVVCPTASKEKPATVKVWCKRDYRSVWLRKRFEVPVEAAGKPLAVNIGACGEGQGSAWFDDRYLGPSRKGDWTVPAEGVTAGSHVVLVAMNGHFVGKGPYEGVDIARSIARARGECLVRLGRIEEALAVLVPTMPSDASWPLKSTERIRVTGRIAQARKLAASGDEGPTQALEALAELTDRWPQLRLDADWLSTAVEAHLARGELDAAALLAGELMSLEDMAEATRRRVLLTAVRIAMSRGDVTAARRHAGELEAKWPYARETADARAATERR